MATFNYAAAVAAGKNPDEINTFLSAHPELQVVGAPDNSVQSPAIQQQTITDQTQPQGNFFSKTLGNVIPDIGGILKGIVSIPDQAIQNAQNSASAMQNPNTNILQKYLASPGGVLAQGLVGEAKRILSNPLQAFQDKPVSTILDILPFLGGGKVAPEVSTTEKAGIAEKAGGVLENAGNKVLQSQYKLSPNEAFTLKPGQFVPKVADLGFKNINDVTNAATKITGSDGLITKLTRDAVSKAKPVETGPFTDTSGISRPGVLDTAQQLASNPVIGNTAETKFMTFMKDGLTKINGLNGANPTDTFEFIQQLEKQSAQLTKSRSITPESEALANAYQGVASELKDRLFIDSGADSAVIDITKNPDVISQARSISPQFADALSQAKNVGDLRSLAAPFVKASQAAVSTATRNAGQVINPTDILAAGGGGVLGGGLGALTSFLGEKLLNSNIGKTAVGGALKAGGQAVSGLGEATSPLLKLLSATKGAINPATLQVLSRSGQVANPNNQSGQQNQQNGSQSTTIVPHSFLDYIDVIQNRKPGSTISPADVAAKTANMAPPLAENVRQAYTQRLGTPAQQAEAQARSDADRVVTNLQNIYNQSGIAGQPGIAGFTGPIADFLAGKIAGSNPTLKAYNAARDAAALSLVSAYADKGIRSSVPSYEKAIELLPSASDSPKDAQAKFDQLRTTLGLIK